MNKKAIIGFGILAIIAIGSITNRGRGPETLPYQPRAAAPPLNPLPSPPPPVAILPTQTPPDPPPDPSAPMVPAPVPKTLYTTSTVRLRVSPSTSARIISTVQSGRAVISIGTDGAWRRVRIGGETGWMHGDHLSDTRPVAKPPQAPVAPAYQPVPLVRQKPAPSRRTGEPVRSPYVGTCDCPYDLMRNGRRCGGRSAYSRPGGRSPSCYH